MDRDVSDILIEIKKKYLSLNVHQYSSYHLRHVADLELQKRDGTNNPTMSHIRYQNILNWHDPTKKLSRKVVFVEGEAGMGKTVLCTLIAKDWASGELFQEFIIVLLLPLNCRNVFTACSLQMLLSELYNLDERKCHILASYLTGPVVKNVLVIADGLDQMGEPGLCEGSFLYRLLFDSVLLGSSSRVTAMTTSRPNHMHRGVPLTTLPNINRFVYVKGFSMDTMQLCVKSEFDNAADKGIASYLEQQLDSNPLLQSLCSVPLNLAMILKLFPSIPCLCDQPLPDTLTGLYTKLCWAHAETSIRCIEQYKSIKSLSSYRDLPGDLQESWWLLCELAFRNIESGSNSSRVDATRLIMSIEIVSFGFLNPVSENSEVKFLHPAFEQYLAVLHLVKQSRDVQLGFIKTHSSDRTLMYYFWQFFFGMYANEVLNSKVKPDDNTVILQTTRMLHQAGNNDYILCRCSFEAQCKLVNDEIINTVSSTEDESSLMTLYFSNARDAYDCIAMIYVLKNVDHQCLVRINFQKCNLRCQHINHLASALYSVRDFNVQVKELDLSDNVLNDLTIADFFHKAAATLKSLEVLSLRSCSAKNKAVNSIMDVLASFSSQSLWQLDLSYNPLSESCLGTIRNLLLKGTLVKLEMLSLKGSLPKDISLKLHLLASLVDSISCQCQNLRQLDLSDNYLGESDNPIVHKIILQLTTNKNRLDLRLNDEYMPIVDENIISAMESSMKNKGTIDHTVAHGVIVGPGRSGKNTLMSRLTGKGPPDPKDVSSSTGVAEKVVKVEVRNTCTVAAACGLKWQRLECDEEALELMMSTAKYHSVSSPVPKRRYKYIRNPKQWKDSKANSKDQLCDSSEGHQDQGSPDDACQSEDSVREDEITNKPIYIRSSDVAPVELLKNALRLKKGDGLREQLESSWSLYLTNTGGQPEFQEYLPFLISGPTIFFITFPLHRDLNKPYTIEYQYPDGRVKSYPSPTTLLEELLQTFATINALRYTVVYENERRAEVRPKVFFIGTHKDCLQDAISNAIHQTHKDCLQNAINNAINEIDKLIRRHVEQTPLYRMVQFAETSKQMIFTVNNFSESDDDFQKIRTKVQKTIREKYYEEFIVKCPTSWLVLSLILREKYQSNRVLHINDCLVIARECGISSSKEMKDALSFIHSRLGLIRYYSVEELNTLVVVDPQIIFDKISELIIGTFINERGEGYEIEDFKDKGIFSEALVKKVSDKCRSYSQQKLSFTWLADLLNYLRIAVLFKDLDGIKKYFFPSALSHAPESSSKLAQTISPVLIAFKGGFCPRGISGALIKCLMTNEMKSKQKWRLLIKKIFRNQVSFHIQGCGTITLKILPTHLEICIEDSTDLKATCEEAYTQIEKCIKMVASQCIKCKHFWRFYCTVAGCKIDPHPAEIEWSRSGTAKELWCKISEKSGALPNGYEMWNIQRKQGKPLMLGALDKEIDEDGVPKHLGQIADFMSKWEGPISENLELTVAEVENIKEEYKSKPLLQKRAALLTWKIRLGKNATYNNLISIFEAAGCKDYADNIRRMFGGHDDTNDSSGDERFPPQPPPYPDPDQLDQSLIQVYYASSPEPSSSSIVMYDAIDSDTAKLLPEGDLHDCDVMQDSNTSIVYVPRLGPDPQSVCKLPGCNRPRFMDPGGKVHACCGKTHALQYEQQNDQESKMATNVDGQGKQRGRCSSCSCDGYDGGSEKKRCVACGHPPGKHQNLSTSSSVSNSSSGVSSISALSPPSTSMGLCDGGMTFYSSSSDSAIFMPSPVYQCRYPGCQKESDFEPNTGVQSDYCHQHIQFIRMISQQYAFTTPRTPQWSIGGNTDSSDVTSDSSDNDQDLHSQVQSDTYGGSFRPMPPAAPSSSSSSSASSWGWANAFSSLLTLQTSTKKTKPQHVSPRKGIQSATPVTGQPVCKLCSKQRHPNGEGGYFDYCSKHCRDHGLQPSNPSMIRQANQQEFSQVSQQFTRDWHPRRGTCPKVNFVCVVSNPALEVRWSAYKQNLQNQTVEEYYHGTKLICDLSSMPCTNADCGVCGISNTGLDRRCIRKNISFQRFGHGFYLTPYSSKCHDYTQGANGYRAMLLCAVCPGRKYTLRTDHVNLKGPPAGYDCVYGQEGSSLNYAEIVVYNPDAVVPRYIIVYQKDGVHKIAK